MMLVHAHHGLDLDGAPVTAGVSRGGEVAAIAGGGSARLSPDGAERLAAWLIVSAAAGRARFAGDTGAPIMPSPDSMAAALGHVSEYAARALDSIGAAAEPPEVPR